MQKMEIEDSTDIEDTQEGLVHSAATDVGMRRDENQDSFGTAITETRQIYIVADGMGGVKGGAVASQLAIEKVLAALDKTEEINEQSVRLAVQDANAAVYGRGQSDPTLTGMGTTLVGVIFTEGHLHLVNVGDSRGYRIRGSEIHQLTQDHTLVGELVRSGALTEDQAQNHPVSHMLTRSLGPGEELEVDCWEIKNGPKAGDLFLLCSDGLYNHVTDADMVRVLHEADGDLKAAVTEFVDLANSRGGTDNITVMIVQVGEDYPYTYEGELESVLISEDAPEISIEAEMVAEHSAEQLTAEAQEMQSEMLGEGEGSGSFLSRRKYLIPLAIVAGLFLAVFLFTPPVNDPASQASSNGATYERNKPVEVSKQEEEKLLDSITGEDSLIEKDQPPIDSGEGSEGSDGEVQVALQDKVDEPDDAEIQVAQNGDDGNPQDADSESPQVDEQEQARVEEREGDLLASLNARRANLTRQIAKFRFRLTTIDKPFSGELGETLDNARRRVEQLREERDEIAEIVTIAEKDLAVWMGRYRRLSDATAVDMASEVAEESKDVQKAKTDFQSASWNYLQAANELQADSGNGSLKDKVQELAAQRLSEKEKLEELMRGVIQARIRDIETVITDQSSLLKDTEGALQEAEVELKFARAVVTSDEAKKKELKSEVEKKISRLESERAALDEILQAKVDSPLS